MPRLSKIGAAALAAFGWTSGTSAVSATYLVVAGGGGGGGAYYAGGGGAGGYQTGTTSFDTTLSYTVVVGAGGAGGTTTNINGFQGSNSQFGTLTASVGGGYGAHNGAVGGNGGSGGGTGNNGGASVGTGTSGQGNNGGSSNGNFGGGGGGGAGAVGANAVNNVGGNGGVGSASSITGTSVTYAGGGGGGGTGVGAGGTGGSGGGGNGGAQTTAPTSATSNTGGGGGGAQGNTGVYMTGGNGGSGIVIISYAGSTQQMAGGTVTISGGNVIHTFTSSGYLTPLKYVGNSLRFRSSASAYLNRTFSTPTNNKIFTYSAWVKLGNISSGYPALLCCPSTTDELIFNFTGQSGTIQYYNNASIDSNVQSNALYRDPAAWYHVVCSVDTTQTTASNRVKLYVNGLQITSLKNSSYPSQNYSQGFNSATPQQIGKATGANYLDGYMTEVNFIDGQALTPNSFGTFNSYGVWQPITYGGSYGTNGFYLPFSNKTSTTTLGYDFSPNGNNWTTNNISLTTGSTYDSMYDVPTLTSATVANYCVLNPLDNGGATISNANLTLTANGATHYYNRGSMRFPTSGKYYWESTVTLTSASRSGLGVALSSIALNAFPFGTAGVYGFYYGDVSNNLYWESGTSTSVFNIAGATGDVIQFAYDADNNNLYAGKNNVFYSSTGATTGNPSTLTNPTSTGVTSSSGYFPLIGCYSAGSTSSNFGQQPFVYTPPTGFVALNTYNL